jgi:putative MATE family efflux protein
MNRPPAALTSQAPDALTVAVPSGYRRIWQLAWPVSLSTSTLTLLTLANLFWVGHLGTVAVAAISLASHILFNIYGLSHLVYAGTLAIVARRFGEGNRDDALAVATRGICLGALLGLLITAIGWACAPIIVGFFAAGAEVEAVAVSYLRIMLIGQSFLSASLAFGAGYQGAGDTWTPMLANTAVILLNVVLDPFFIFPTGGIALGPISLGWLAWGVNGAAVAAVLSSIVGAGLFLILFLNAEKNPFRPTQWTPRIWDPEELWHIVRVGWPASISVIARPLSTFLLLKVIATFGTSAIAAFGIAFRSFSINWIPYSGIIVAVSTLVGQNLGARHVDEAQRVVWRGIVACTALGIAFCILYYAFAHEVMSAFDGSPAVVSAGVPFLRLIALSFLFSAPMYPMVSAMNGAGDTMPPMIVAFLANWPVKLPLCYALALPFGYGINGVWIGMFVSIVFEAVVAYAWYRRGTWKTKKV